VEEWKEVQSNGKDLREERRFLAYGTSTLDPAIRLVDRAREIECAHESIRTHTNAKLELIVKQIRHLQEEAREIIEKAAVDADLHRIPCNFEKNILQPYHLYRKQDGSKYFSFLSPDDWNGSPPHEYLGTYQMKSDRSFERLDDSNPQEA